MKDAQVILEIVKELRADASLNYKKEILARYSDYKPFKEFIKSKSKNTDSLFLPRFVEVREDKNTATSYEEIIG